MSDFSNTPGWHGGVEIRTNACLIAFSTLFLGMRIYVRVFMTKSLGWDDLIACIAWAVLTTQSSLDIRNVSFGSGAHIELVQPPELLNKFFESLAIQKCVYFWAVAFVRWSILAFLPRLSSDKIVIYSIYSIGSFIFAQTVASFVFLLTSCWPIEDNFKPPFVPGLKCRPATADAAMMEGHAAAGIAIDILLLILPIYIIYSKMMWSKRTIQVILVMSIGIFVVVVGIIRLVLIKTLDFYTDSTYKMGTIGIWTNLEGQIGFWCCCFPALQPILRIISYKLGIRSMLNSYGKSTEKHYGAGRNGAGGAGAPRSGNHGLTNGSRSQPTVTTKNGYVKNGSGVDNSSDTDSVQAIVISGKAMEDDSHLMEMNTIDMGRKGGAIHKRIEVSVQTEQLDPGSKPRRVGPGVANSWRDMD